MTIKPLKPMTSYCGGTREREVFRNAIYQDTTFICEISTPYRNKLKTITETVLKELPNDTIGATKATAEATA